MGGAGDDLQIATGVHQRLRLAIELDDGGVEATHDQQRGAFHPFQGVTRQVRTAAARDDCPDRLWRGRGGPQGSGRAGAGAEQALRQGCQGGLCRRPLAGLDQPPAEQLDVEAVGVGPVLLLGQEVEHQGGQAAVLQGASDLVIAGAQAAAAAAMREDDQSDGRPGQVEDALVGVAVKDEGHVAFVSVRHRGVATGGPRRARR